MAICSLAERAQLLQLQALRNRLKAALNERRTILQSYAGYTGNQASNAQDAHSSSGFFMSKIVIVQKLTDESMKRDFISAQERLAVAPKAQVNKLRQLIERLRGHGNS